MRGIMMRSVCIAFALLAATAHAQDEQVRRFTQSVALALDKVSSTSTYDAKTIDRLSASAFELEKLLSALPEGLPSEYQQVFGYYADMLDTARRDAEQPESRKLVAFVDADLSFKLKYAKSFMSLTPSALLVNTDFVARDSLNSKDVSGLSVRCNPLGWGDRLPMRHSFGALTPVRGGRLTPGYYLVFAYLGDKLVGSKEVTIGLEGQRTETVVIPVTP